MKVIDLKNFIIHEKASIIQALEMINENLKGTVVVVDRDGRIKGTLTDGDIRRALLKGVTINESIESIYCKNCKYINEAYDGDYINLLMEVDKIKLIPVVDMDNKVVNIISSDDFTGIANPTKANYVLIMAGGLGSRLKPLTDDIPKPMLKIGDKPILEILIDQFKQKKFKKILISVNYKADIIENYFQSGQGFNMDINYIRENKRMGTAGAIKLAEKYLKEPFVVINGDIVTNANFENILEYHIKNNFDITIGTRLYDMQVPYGVLNLDDICVTSLEEKPIVNFTVSGGIYVLNPSVMKHIPEDAYFDMTDLINCLLAEKGRIGSFPIEEYWMDIGQVKDYYKANEDMHKIFKY